MSRKQKGFKFKVGDYVESSKYLYYVTKVIASEDSYSPGDVYIVKNLITRTKIAILKRSAERTLKFVTLSPAMVALYCDKDKL